jgi:uncharacterized protein
MTVLETLLADLPTGWWVNDVYVGANWALSLVSAEKGLQVAGVATTPRRIAADSRFQIGHYPLAEDAAVVARLLLSPDESTAAVGLATLNALNRPDETGFSTIDAADWLSAQSVGRRVAMIGRFPFIDAEIRPYAHQVWVFEQEPQAGESSDTDMATILPQADIVAITGSSILNHTLDFILSYTRPDSIVVLLGPSTPLVGKLFESNIAALFGVRVVDTQEAIESVIAGDGFQKMHGLQRVSLFK